MKNFRWYKLTSATLGLGLILQAHSASACAACYGRSDSPLALGMNYGIGILLCFVVVVLSGVATAGIYLVKKAAAVAAEEAIKTGSLATASQKV